MDPEEGKRKYWKFSVAFVAMIFLAVGSVIAWRMYQTNERAENLRRLAQQVEREQEALYQKQLADTYGGKTPQETLRLYIEAVEKGDYELASRYFVIEKQEGELESFKKATNDFIDEYNDLLNQAARNKGNYTTDGNYFSIDKPILVRMIKYPSGVWKIIEI